MSKNPFSPLTHPNVHRGHEYALDIVSGKIPACRYMTGACVRYLRDLERPEFPFDADIAERFLRMAQRFVHIKGTWSTPNIVFEPWQCWIFMNIFGFQDPRTGYRRFRIAYIEVPRGNGKPLGLETTVPTPQGFKKWREIGVGSELYDRNGRVCRVVRKNQTFLNPKTQKIVFSDGSEIITGLDHEWYTSNKAERERESYHEKECPPKRRNKFGEIVANTCYEGIRTTREIKETLKVRGESNHLVRLCEVIEGEEKELPVDPYVFGLWLGDGNSHSQRISAHMEDAEETISLLRQRGVQVTLSDYHGSNKGRTLNLVGVQANLRLLGVLGNKHIPDLYLTASASQRLDLLRGLLDSDGFISKDGQVEITSGYPALWSGIEYLISSLGYKLHETCEFKVSETNNFASQRTFRRLSFYPRGEEKVFLLRRKADRQVSSQGNHTYLKGRYVVDVVDVDPQEMFCVEVDSPDHSFVVTERCIPTHNSALASIAALYMLALDNPKGNEVSCFATKSDQARIVLDSSRAMARENKSFLKATGTEVLAHSIKHDKSNSIMRARSSDYGSLDGLNDVLSIIDELHAVTQELYDVVVSGLKKRRDSLLLCITTAGTSVDGVGFDQSSYSKKILLGDVEDDQTFAAVYTIDEGDDIFSEETWKKANPNYGVSVDPIQMEATARKSKEIASECANFKVKNLNIWTSEMAAYFDLKKWDACADPALDIETFRGRLCKIGVDLASRIDITTFVSVFKLDDIYYVFDRSYIPEGTVREVNSALYNNCIAQGHLIQTPGEAINQDTIRKDIVEFSKKFRIGEAMFDPWNAASLMSQLSQDRIECVEFRMTVANLSEPMKTLDELIRKGKIRHNGSPLLRFCIGNVVAKVDANENVFPRKSSEKLKIDLAVALLMALAGHIQDAKQTSIYDRRESGLRIL